MRLSTGLLSFIFMLQLNGCCQGMFMFDCLLSRLLSRLCINDIHIERDILFPIKFVRNVHYNFFVLKKRLHF